MKILDLHTGIKLTTNTMWIKITALLNIPQIQTLFIVLERNCFLGHYSNKTLRKFFVKFLQIEKINFYFSKQFFSLFKNLHFNLFHYWVQHILIYETSISRDTTFSYFELMWENTRKYMLEISIKYLQNYTFDSNFII